MRILHVISSLDPIHGGPTEAIHTLIRNRPKGFTNDAATLDSPDAPFVATAPFKFYALGTTPARWASWKMIPWLIKNRDNYDAILLHGLWGFTSIAILVAVVGRVPYAVFPHGMLDPYFKRRYPLKHLKKLFFWVTVQYWVLRYAQTVMFTAQSEKELAPESFAMWRWNPFVVSYGADPPPVDHDKILAAFYQACPDVKGKRFLLFLSRINKKKGCDLLIEAFAAMPRDPSNQGVHLVMAGPDKDNWRQELTSTPAFAKIADRVHWPGMLRGDAKWGAFEACEAFILPSHQENFGIVIAEALSRAKPVLITDKINIADEITAGKCGFVEDDTRSGVDLLLQKWFALSPEERETMSRHALETFDTQFDMKKNTGKIFSIFKERARRTS